MSTEAMNHTFGYSFLIPKNPLKPLVLLGRKRRTCRLST